MTATHLVWDWNGTLLDDLHLVVSSTNVAFASAGGRDVGSDEHRRAFRRPVADFYAEMLGRAIDEEEFGRLDRIFHDAYRLGLTDVTLAADAQAAIKSWPGSQSLLSMWFHHELARRPSAGGDLSGVAAGRSAGRCDAEPRPTVRPRRRRLRTAQLRHVTQCAGGDSAPSASDPARITKR
ncbi:HAD family hydrolase [Actinoplanes philippinensis]|uniref:HAD family hydrolase n=1 Tax=Actinoplanes philippinensis TaxID=35752 RepID=UPI0033C654CA